MRIGGTLGGVTASAGQVGERGVDSALLGEWMDVALGEARAALEHGDVPVGALVVAVDSGAVIARRHNERELTGDPTAHAEMLALRDAAATVGTWRLDEYALVATVEPCPMCAGAAGAARVALVVFGVADPKAGARGSLYNLAADPRLNHSPQVVAGVREQDASDLMRAFFGSRRG